MAWSFDRHDDRSGIPHTNVFLRVNGRRIRVLRNVGYAFQVLGPQEYSAHNVPWRAVAACTNWWAGQGEDLYVIRRKRQLMVFSRIVDEQAPIPAFTRLKTIPWCILGAFFGDESAVKSAE